MSNEEDLGLRLGNLVEADDVPGLEELFAEHPDFIDPSPGASIMFDAARAGAIHIMAWFVKKGFSVNGCQSFSNERLIESAVALERLEMTRWLVEHGAEVNYGNDGFRPYCGALSTAVRYGNLEMAQILVEAGALLNVLDRTNRTPLSWAIEHNQPAIADYLRSKGALEAHQIPGYKLPEKLSPIAQWLVNRGAFTPRLSWVPIIPGAVSVGVRWVEGPDGDWRGLITDGMSNQPMNVPVGQEAYRYAELLLLLTDVSSPEELQQSPHQWTINWLQQLAQYPFEHRTWLGAPVTVVANGDPPEPLAPGVGMTCWLLCAHKPPLTRAKPADGKEVVFYTILPIHTAERDFERDRGAPELLHRFAQKNVPEHFVADRPKRDLKRLVVGCRT